MKQREKSGLAYDPDGCVRTLSGHAARNEDAKARRQGLEYDPAHVTTRMRDCLRRWVVENETPRWIARNAMLNQFDGWYSAAAQPFLRGNFTVSTDVLTICSRVSGIAWIRASQNDHGGSPYGAATLAFAAATDSSSNRRRGTNPKLWEDVDQQPGHPMSCDFLDFYAAFVLPVARANGQVRDQMQQELIPGGLPRPYSQQYRDSFKKSGGAAINDCLLTHAGSPGDFTVMTGNPCSVADLKTVRSFFVDIARRKSAAFREQYSVAAEHAADLIDEHLRTLGLGEPSLPAEHVLSAKQLRKLRRLWSGPKVIQLAHLLDDPRSDRIAAQALTRRGRPATREDREVVLEAARFLWEREAAADVLSGDENVAQVILIPADYLAGLIGAWLDNDPALSSLPGLTSSSDPDGPSWDVAEQIPSDALWGYSSERALAGGGGSSSAFLARDTQRQFVKALRDRIGESDELGHLAERIALSIVHGLQSRSGSQVHVISTAVHHARVALTARAESIVGIDADADAVRERVQRALEDCSDAKVQMVLTDVATQLADRLEADRDVPEPDASPAERLDNDEAGDHR